MREDVAGGIGGSAGSAGAAWSVLETHGGLRSVTLSVSSEAM